MRSLFDFERYDEKFVAQVRGAKDREISIARLSKVHSLQLCLSVVSALACVGSFIGYYAGGKVDSIVVLAPIVGFLSVTSSFAYTNLRVKVLKLAQQDEPK